MVYKQRSGVALSFSEIFDNLIFISAAAAVAAGISICSLISMQLAYKRWENAPYIHGFFSPSFSDLLLEFPLQYNSLLFITFSIPFLLAKRFRI